MEEGGVKGGEGREGCRVEEGEESTIHMEFSIGQLPEI